MTNDEGGATPQATGGEWRGIIKAPAGARNHGVAAQAAVNALTAKDGTGAAGNIPRGCAVIY